MFCPYTDEGRVLIIAYIFEQWARLLLHCKHLSLEEWFARKGRSHFDIDHEGLNTLVEIKGSSNTDQIKLFEDQLDDQLSELGFPVEKGFVWIFSYRNRASAGGRERLVMSQPVEKIEKFLAEHLNTVYIVDLHLLSAWRKSHGTKSYDRDRANPRKVVAINRTDLRDIAENTRTTLRELGFREEVNLWLPPCVHSIKSRRVKSVIGDVTLDFELVPLLPIGRKIKLFKQLHGSVQKV